MRDRTEVYDGRRKINARAYTQSDSCRSGAKTDGGDCKPARFGKYIRLTGSMQEHRGWDTIWLATSGLAETQPCLAPQPL